jgi:hypothetical protein
MSGTLGRELPPDWEHVEKYPLRALSAVERPVQIPVVLGINWYSNFDRPQQDSKKRWWIGKGDLGSLRGGHCICARPLHVYDAASWWDFYDQGEEGACVGFGCSRMQTLNNRMRYDGQWLYRECKKRDGLAGDGTFVRTGLEVLRDEGPARVHGGLTRPPATRDGIDVFRWLDSWDEVRRTLGVPADAPGVPLLNSWGRSYPHVTWITDEAGERVLAEEGEAAVATDR